MDDESMWGTFHEWSRNEKDSKELIKIMEAIHLLMDGCTHNLSRSQLETIQKRMKSTIKQCIFWQKQNNVRNFGILWVSKTGAKFDDNC